jgi:hypothetical protein
MLVLGDAAKETSRKVRDRDSICILMQCHCGVILPAVDTLAVNRISARLVERLIDGADASNRSSFMVDAMSYAEQTASASGLELAVTQLMPENSLNQTIRREVLISR